MTETIKVAARSRSETLLKLYMDNAVYKELLECALPLGISPLDLVRAIIAEKFPNVPYQEIPIGGYRPKPRMDNRPGQFCERVGCEHSWGDHNYDKAGNELPDGGPCIACSLEGKSCARFV